MAAGVCVVSANVGSASAIIADGQDGYLIEPDPTAFADAIQRLAGDRVTRRRVGQNATATAESYQWSDVLDNVVRTYRDLSASRIGSPSARTHTPRMKASTSVLNAAGPFEVRQMSGAFDRLILRTRDQMREFARQRGRSHFVLGSAQDQRRDVDFGRALALVGEPHGFCADAVSGGVDPGHRLDHLAAHRRVGGLGEQHVDPRFGHRPQIVLAASERS